MPAVLSVLSDASPLSHLKVCPQCDSSRVSAPILCKGQKYPDHEDWWYEKCLDNHRPTHTSCTHFSWREDLGKGKRSTSAPCGGTLCQQLRAGRRVNLDCTFGLCSRCCVEVRSVHPDVRACGVSAHAKAVVPATLAPRADGDDVSLVDKSAPPGGAPRASPSKGASSLVSKAPASHKQRSYAISISPIYQERLTVLEETDRRRVEAAEVEADYAQHQNRLVTVYWWGANGKPASVFVVEASRFPYFHPRDSPQLVTRFNSDTQPFQYFEWKLLAWVHGDASSPVRNLKTAGELHYRSDGIDHAPDMPPHGLKRGLDEPEEYGRHSSPSTPMKRSSSANFGGAAAWTCSSSVFATPSSSLRASPFTSFDTPSSTTTTTPQSVRSSFSASPALTSPLGPGGPPDTPDRLPALFPGMISLSSSPSQTPPPPPPPHASGSAVADLEPDLGPAPRSRFGWPLLYVCDMAAGFAAMRRLEDLGQSRSAAFEEVFKEKLVRSTWSDNSRVWMASARQPEVRDTWIRAGRTELGLWKAFVREIRNA